MPCFSQESESISIPVIFENNLIYVTAQLESGDTLKLYTDTGGKNYLYQIGRKKLELPRSRRNLWNAEVESVFIRSEIPLPNTKELYFMRDKSATEDGMLGREWFAGKTWLFDYKNKSLHYLQGDQEKIQPPKNSIPLYFKEDSMGIPSFHLPRLIVNTDSDTLSLLMDTGAQAFLSDEAQTILRQSKKVAISFIKASIYQKWSAEHPEWEIIEDGDKSFGETAPIIVVPEIQLGERKIGPVAFAVREDSNFEIMSDYFMDEPIDGALGGNALSLLNQFVINYKEKKLTFPKQ
jgi:hypothetical protein